MRRAIYPLMMTPTRQKTVRVGDVMTSSPLTLAPDQTLEDAARLFTNAKISGAAVVDTEGCIVGVLSKTDVLECSPFIPHSPHARVRDAMSRTVITLRGADSAMSAVKLMSENRVHRIVVVSAEGRPIGMLSAMDVIHALARGEPLQGGDAAYEDRRERHGEPAPAIPAVGRTTAS
jgi:predicted transcriptional regulator